jgi:hypothetical protein
VPPEERIAAGFARRNTLDQLFAFTKPGKRLTRFAELRQRPGGRGYCEGKQRAHFAQSPLKGRGRPARRCTEPESVDGSLDYLIRLLQERIDLYR